MLERPQKVLRLACVIFGALLIAQLALLIKRGDPLNRLTIPQVPTLPSTGETNKAAGKPGDKQGTNTAATKAASNKGTNQIAALNSTNTTPAITGKGTNAVSGDATNASAAITQTNAVKGTNISLAEAPKKEGTNAGPSKGLVESGTNSISATNLAKIGTNAMGKAATNAVPGKELAKKGGPPGRPEPGKVAADLPPLIKARVEHITQSEILGQIPRPMPMALLGIADKDVFLRAPDGQTGVIKEGGELGGVKLLKIGINRVLIEQEGQKKELTLFSGLGSETLMPKTTDKTNETTNKSP